MLSERLASAEQDNRFKGEFDPPDPNDEAAIKNLDMGATRNGIEISKQLARVSPVRLNHRGQIDVISMGQEESGVSGRWVMIYEEQYSKFVVLRSLRSMDPGEVAKELVDILTTIGAPRIIQSGNGRNYAEQVVREIRLILRDFCVVHGDATKNSETRRDFKSIVNSLMRTNPSKSLKDCLRIIQVSENTKANFHNGKVPSQLFFGRNICDDLRRAIGAKGSIIFSETGETTQNDLLESAKNSGGTKVENIPIENPIIHGTSKVDDPSDTAPRAVKPDTNEDQTMQDSKKRLTCGVCQKEFTEFVLLENHAKTHARIGNFQCTLCPKAFRVSSIYEKHLQRFHYKKKNIPDKSVRQEEDEKEDPMASHVNEKSEEAKKRCTDSSDETPKKSRKKAEDDSSSAVPLTTKQNGNSLLECTFCKQKFNFPSVLKRHMRSHTNERPYVCQICNKSFKQLGHLTQHSLTHTDYRSFECATCSLKCDSLNSLKIHSQSHDEPNKRSRETYRLFECDICKKVFTTKSVIERHIPTHTHERQFACKICDKRFKQAGHVKSHMLVHTGERKFECNVCSKRFSLSNSLKKHMYVHNGEKPYQCDVCGSRFLEKRNLNGHLMTHTNEKPHSCKICGKRYTLADTLRRHISAAHEDGRTYQCEICAKMFKQLAHLSVHKKVHNDERPFQCHLCEKNFKHKNVLKSHLAIHANLRPFECDTCKSTFVRKTNLQTHIASAHMNERPYVCTICNKRFKQISHLNGHIVVHSNSMPYQCDFCDRRCNRLDNLKKHMRLHTKT